MHFTRVFRRPYANGAFMLTVQLSFTSEKEARTTAKHLDKLKARAALDQKTFSKELSQAIADRALKRRQL